MPLDTQARPRHSRTLSKKLLLGITASLVAVSAAYAASSTWTGTTNGTWDTATAANWGGTAFSSGNDALFTGTPTNNVTTATGLTIGAITLNNTFTGSVTMSGPNTVSGATMISGGTLNLTNSGGLGAGAGSSAITVNSGGILNLSAGSATYANAVSGAGVVNVTTNPSGDATLTGAWSGFTGTLNLNGSGNFKTRLTTNQANLISSSATININAGTTLYLNQGLSYGASVHLFGAGNSENLGALRIESNANQTGSVTLHANSFIGNNQAATISGVIGESGGNFGFTKQGNNVLTLSGNNTFTGPIILNSGTVSVGSDSPGAYNLGGATGDNGITFNGGSLQITGTTMTSLGSHTPTFNAGVALGFDIANAANTFTVSNNIAIATAGNGILTKLGAGKLTLSGSNTIGNSLIASAGTLEITGATTTDGGSTGGRGFLTVSGNTTLTIATGGSFEIRGTTGSKPNSIVGQNAAGTSTVTVNGGSFTVGGNTGFILGNNINTATGVLTISSGTATITAGSATLQDMQNYISMGRDNANGIINLDGGTLATGRQFVRDGSGGGTVGSGAATFNFNGGILQAQADQTSGNGWFETATAGNFQIVTTTVKAGGAKIDTNGFNTVIQTVLAHDGGLGATADGGLVKLGTGTLTLTGVNTYTGNTTVSDGTLALADNASIKFVIGANGVNNKVTGAGVFTVNGDFVFDLSGASTTLDDSWQIVDVATLSETYGGTFTVTGFAPSGDKLVRPANDVFYEFDPATGVLRVINDPGLTYPAPSVTQGSYVTSYAVGSDIVLSVSASGVGTLTYQWYYQADAGATPVAISGATGSTLTVSSTTIASGGIYSVVVTDHAAETSGQPPTTTTSTFSPISVQPAASLAVAYYRFEDGANDAGISPALDSVGTSNLTLLGAATYTNAGLPYATIPATGDANTLGANFPGSGNNGLVAPASGTLGDTAFTDFTVEAFVRFSDLGGFQTVVGRDDVTTGVGTAGQAIGGQGLFYLSKGSDNRFRVELITADNRNIQINGASIVTAGTWYHVAAVGKIDTGTLKLYVNGTEVGSVTGFNGLFVPTTGSDTPWTVGRGDSNLSDTDFLRGDVDEVRITRAALAPGQFLNSAGGVAIIAPTASVSPASTSVYPGANVVFTATASSNMGGTLGYQWYKAGVALTGETTATLSLSSVTLGSDGVYSVVVTDSVVGGSATTTATARLVVLDVPAAGARAIGLNFVGAGNGNWSAQLGILSASQSAGIYPMANWNNSASVTQVSVQSTPFALAESTGSTAAAITATWNSTGAWSARTGTGSVTQKTADALLLHGYIESRLASGSTVTVSNIPYASYDVYVHVAGGANGEVGSLKIDRESSPTYHYRVLQHDGYVPSSAPTVEAPYTVPFVIGESPTRTAALASAPATFVRFTGVTGSDLTITAIDQILTKNSGGIASVQIVDRTSAGAAYPPIVTSAPVSKLAQGGANVSFAVVAVSQNSGTLSYQWEMDGADLPGQTGATLNLSNVTGASSGNYSVTITDTSGLGTATATRSASLVVVDGTRSLLINGDINIAASPTYVGDAILRADGTEAATNVSETIPSVWNGILGASGAATRLLTKESAGLSLAGVTFSYTGANGAEDNTLGGGGVIDPASELERDYLFANADSVTPLVGTISGLQAFAGKQVRLLVYAVGKTAKAGAAVNSATVNDVATVNLATANNHLLSSAGKTTVAGVGSTEDPGRNIEWNNPYSYGTEIYPGAGYVAFTGVVDSSGSVSWNLTPVAAADGGGGLVPLVGFQLLVTNIDVAPPVPTGLSATAGTGQISLNWTASSGAESYTVKRATSEAGPYTMISAGLSATSLTDNNVTAGSTYYYTVAAKNSLAQSADSAPVSATPLAALSKLQTWRQTNFNISDNSGDAANTADPDGDGIANLLEYAFGTNPKSAGTSPLTVARFGNVLTLTFAHVDDSTLSYAVQASDDLAVWTTKQSYTGFTAAGSTTYTDDASLDTHPRRFLKLVVTAP